MAKSSLKSKRKYIKGLITRANKKIQELIKDGVLQDSFAYQTAMDTRSKAKHVKYGVDNELAFSIEGMKSGRELDREKGRILAFLSNATSEAENARIEKQAFEAYQRWNGKFFSKGIKGATGGANDSILSVAAEVYRRLFEGKEAAVLGNTYYDSNSMINYLYDIVNDRIEDPDDYLSADMLEWIPGLDEPEERKEAVDALMATFSPILKKIEEGLIRGNFASPDINVGELRQRKGRRSARR